MSGWRFGVVLALVGSSGCGFRHGALPETDGGGLETDALQLPPGEHWLFETAADFGASGSDTQAITVEPRGALTLDGYLYGGLVMYGKQDQQFWSTTSTSYDWSAIATVTPDGTALWNTEYVDTTTSFVNAGVTADTKFSLWFEGEIYLDAGDLLSLDADGAGFVDLRMPTGWTRVLLGKSDGIHTTTTPIATAGWYEVRIGYGEGTSSGHLDFRRGPSGTAVHFERHRLRAAASRLRGTLREVFYRQILGGAQYDSGSPVPSVEASDLIAPQTFPTTVLGANSTLDWSARWFGQMYAATAGTYALQVISDDGNNVSFAGVTVPDHWARGDSTAAATTNIQATVTAGWHDLVLDYNQTAGACALSVVVTAAPDASLVGAAIPLTLLRPVEPRGDRLISATGKFTAIDVSNNNTTGATRAIAIDGFASETVTSIDVTVHVNTAHLDQLVFSLQRPGGTKVTIANHPTGGAVNGYVQFSTTAAGLIGQAPAGTWTLGVADDTSGTNTTSFDEAAITIHTSGGPEQIALAGTWVSPVRDIGVAPVHVIDVVWSERAAIASDVFLRACAMADCSDDPAWGSPLAQHATVEAATRYLQVKVAMTSDGTTEPELDTLAVTYRTDSPP